MRTYAAETSVSSAKTLEQIKRLLVEFGATDLATGERPGQAAIMFTLADRRIRFVLPLPPMSDFETRIVRGRKVKASPAQTLDAWDQSCRTKWRALLLAIKAKLTSAQAGVETLEEAFLAQVVTRDGSTVWQNVKANAGYLASAKALPAGDA